MVYLFFLSARNVVLCRAYIQKIFWVQIHMIIRGTSSKRVLEVGKEKKVVNVDVFINSILEHYVTDRISLALFYSAFCYSV